MPGWPKMQTYCALLAIPFALSPAFCQIQRVNLTPQIAKLRPLTSEQQEVLAGVRAYTETYLSSLPDYICIQTTKRRAQSARLDSWPVSDEVREQLTFSGHRETYEIQSVNGRPVHNMERSALGGNMSTGEFGTLLERVFAEDSKTEFGYERRTTLGKVPVDVFAYRVSNEHGYTLYSGTQKYESAWEGLIYAEHATGKVLKIRMECIGIPVNFPVHHLNMTLDYGAVKIGDREYILPAHFELNQESSGGVTYNRADYGSYRKFDAESRFTADIP